MKHEKKKNMEREIIYFEQGWSYMLSGITKLKRILEGLPEPAFDSEHYMMLYETVYHMCTQKPPHDYSQQLYDKYREAFEEYINLSVLPALREVHDEYLLKELVKRWSNHKVMIRWLARFFYYLDRYFIVQRSLPSLNEVALTCFCDLVNKEREGEQIDRTLLKNVLDIYVEIGMGKMKIYETDFESFMLQDTASYYSHKASSWIQEDSCSDYMLKSEECLEKERERVAEYLHSSSVPKLVEVLPALREKHDEDLLNELAKRWSNHKVMFKWLSSFFSHLDRYFICKKSLPSLKKVALTCFHDLVYNELHSEVKDVVIALVNKEREGEKIDRTLVKNVLDIYVEIGMGLMERYEQDFESFMLQHTASYYSRKASSWIQEDSCPDYMLKSEECLEKEKERVAHYLHSSSVPKLVEKIHHELLVVYATQLLENEHSGLRALLRDDKVDDLSRIYRLYHKCDGGWEPVSNMLKELDDLLRMYRPYHKCDRGLELVANIFKQLFTAEGNTIVQQAQDTNTEQVLVRKVTELHDKYMVYVTECFQNHTIFKNALKESFGIIVATSSSAELRATFL